MQTQWISPCSQISPRKSIPRGMTLIAVKFGWYCRVTSLQKKSHRLKQYLHYHVPCHLFPSHPHISYSHGTVSDFAILSQGLWPFWTPTRNGKAWNIYPNSLGKHSLIWRRELFSFWMIQVQSHDSQYHTISQGKVTPKPNPALSSAFVGP